MYDSKELFVIENKLVGERLKQAAFPNNIAVQVSILYYDSRDGEVWAKRVAIVKPPDKTEWIAHRVPRGGSLLNKLEDEDSLLVYPIEILIREFNLLQGVKND